MLVILFIINIILLAYNLYKFIGIKKYLKNDFDEHVLRKMLRRSSFRLTTLLFTLIIIYVLLVIYW
ncbi:competence protein ComGC [Robertmurraya andreesenii]|uniref:Competence protein ComGC n=1 Tax=Anoxybacillus andreesenii TaxID=1325932 RepID=A0ABT9V695_9BACL|nr:competence protein ComGC [Robertmurraya andreesenii]